MKTYEIWYDETNNSNALVPKDYPQKPLVCTDSAVLVQTFSAADEGEAAKIFYDFLEAV